MRRPDTATTGDTNPWDAADYMGALINRLGDNVSDFAIAALTKLRDAPQDGYSAPLRIAVAEQKRKRVEADWIAPDLPTIAGVVADAPPTTGAQLQAVILAELHIVQAKLRGSDVDWYRDFYDARTPRVENDCRDTLLKMIRPVPFGIEASPEVHLADEMRCDIVCTLGNLMVPIEIKGQWHAALWTAADHQLDRLYTNDCWGGRPRGILCQGWLSTFQPEGPS